MSTNIDYSKGILHHGNTYRLKQAMFRAEKGENIVIGFIGGSITQGSVASTPDKCYAYRVFEWWRNNFPKSDIKYVNAGIGATDSQFGVARVNDDIIAYKPDVVITEFSVNDENNEHFLETYEGLVRRIYNSASKPAIITMNNVCYDTGYNAEKQHVRIAKHYDMPAVGIRSTIYEAIKEGTINAVDITPDNLHPNDEGHALVAGQITFFLDMVKAEEKCSNDIMLTQTITANTYEASTRLNNKNSNPKTVGFIKDTDKQNGISDCFKTGWTASTLGDCISFTVRGTNLSVQYRKSCKHPAPVARLVLDKDTKNSIILDANFDETWGDKLFLTTIAEGLEDCEHEITIELIETHMDDTAPFYLAAILVSGEAYR